MEAIRSIHVSCFTQCTYWTHRSKYHKEPDNIELDIVLIAKLSRQIKDLIDRHVTIPVTRSSKDVVSAVTAAQLALTAELISKTARWIYLELEELFELNGYELEDEHRILQELETTRVPGPITIAVENKARSAAAAEKALALLRKEAAPVMAAFGRRLVGPDDEEMAELWQELIQQRVGVQTTVEEQRLLVARLQKSAPEPGQCRPTFLMAVHHQLDKLNRWLLSTATLPQILLSLPVVPLHRRNRKGKMKFREKMGDNCGICPERFYDGGMGVTVVVSLPVCGHRFHKECAMEWLHRQNTCPMCRRRFVSVEECEEWACKVDKDGRRARRRRRRGRLGDVKRHVVEKEIETAK